MLLGLLLLPFPAPSPLGSGRFLKDFSSNTMPILGFSFAHTFPRFVVGSLSKILTWGNTIWRSRLASAGDYRIFKALELIRNGIHVDARRRALRSWVMRNHSHGDDWRKYLASYGLRGSWIFGLIADIGAVGSPPWREAARSRG